MELEGAAVLALLTSNDERKRLLGLVTVRKQAAANGAAGASMMMPLVIQRFLAPPLTSSQAKKGGILSRKIAYTLLPAAPVYGSAWVTVANAIDRDVQAATQAGEGSPALGELGVYALRSVLAMPFAHLDEYVRSRWEAIVAMASHSRNTTLRLAAIDAIILAVRPPAGLERHEQEILIQKMVSKPHFAETLRRLLTDADGEIAVRAFQLLSVMQLATNAGQHGAPTVLISPMPIWLLQALGFTQEVCQEVLHRAGRLSLKQQQCAQHTLLALCLAIVKLHGSLVSILLSLSDSILHTSLHSDWNGTVVLNAGISLLSVVTHRRALLLSLFPHLALCVEKVIGVVQKHLTAVQVQAHKAKVDPTEGAKTIAPFPVALPEVLFSLLSLMPVAQRLRHCLTLLAHCCEGVSYGTMRRLGLQEDGGELQRLVHAIIVVAAKLTSASAAEVAGSMEPDAQEADKGKPSKPVEARFDIGDIAPVLQWAAHHSSTFAGSSFIESFLGLLAAHLRGVTTATPPIPGSSRAREIRNEQAVAASAHIEVALRIVGDLYYGLRGVSPAAMVMCDGFRSILEVITGYLLVESPSGFSPASNEPQNTPTALAIGRAVEAFNTLIAMSEGALPHLIQSMATVDGTLETDGVVGELDGLSNLHKPERNSHRCRTFLLLQSVARVVYLRSASPLESQKTMWAFGQLVLGKKEAPQLSGLLCKAMILAVEPILLSGITSLGGSASATGASASAAGLGENVSYATRITQTSFRDAFEQCLDIVQCLYGSCVRLGQVDKGITSPVVDFVHEELLGDTSSSSRPRRAV